MKKIIKVKFLAEDPLVITDGSAESLGHKTLHYIPGNMLLGAFASCWVRKHKNEDPDLNPEFNSFFLNGKVSWGNAFPMCGQEPSVPIPLCFLRIKNHEGLPVIGQKEFSECLVTNCIELNSGDTDAVEKQVQKLWPEKELSNVKTKKFQGGFMGENSLNETIVEENFTMHVALNEDGTAADGQLFGFSSISTGTIFISEIVVDGELEEDLKKLISSEKEIRVGHSRSAGYGRVKVELDTTETFKTSENKVNGERVYLYLKSPYISHNSYTDPFSSLEKKLREIPGFREIDKDRLYDGFRNIAGFNNLWKKPRRTRSAIKEGSVFSLICDDSNLFIKSLPFALGGDIHEGYGRIIANPSFLMSNKLAFKAIELKEPEKKDPIFASSNRDSFAVRLLRKRMLLNICEKESVKFIHNPSIQSFIDSQKNSISSSQRGIVRTIICTHPNSEWTLCFEELLKKKTVKELWDKAEGICPFHSNGFKDHLGEIMKRLLSTDSSEGFFSKFSLHLVLPGGSPSQEEKSSCNDKYQKLCLLRLLKEIDLLETKSKKANV